MIGHEDDRTTCRLHRARHRRRLRGLRRNTGTLVQTLVLWTALASGAFVLSIIVAPGCRRRRDERPRDRAVVVRAGLTALVVGGSLDLRRGRRTPECRLADGPSRGGTSVASTWCQEIHHGFDVERFP